MTEPDPLAVMSDKDLRAMAAGRGVPGSAELPRVALTAALGVSLSESRIALEAQTAIRGTSSRANQADPCWQPASAPPVVPLPSSPGVDRLVCMVQDPSHVFIYWEITTKTWERIQEAAPGTVTTVLAIHAQAGCEQREVDLRGGNYYLVVAPGTTYCAELCLRGQGGLMSSLVAASPVTTPISGPSSRTDESWMAVDESFHDLLSLAGQPGSLGSSDSRCRTATMPVPRMIGFGTSGMVSTPGVVPFDDGRCSDYDSLVESANNPAPYSSRTLHRADGASSRNYPNAGLSVPGSMQASSRGHNTPGHTSDIPPQTRIDASPEPLGSIPPIYGTPLAPCTGLPKAVEGIARLATGSVVNHDIRAAAIDEPAGRVNDSAVGPRPV